VHKTERIKNVSGKGRLKALEDLVLGGRKEETQFGGGGEE